MKASSYCSGNRLGLGSDILHGIGVESLKKCAEYALSDSRCDGTGYFDAYRRGGAYQCKCPENGACLINAGSGPGWSIFRASYSGTYSLDLLPKTTQNKKACIAAIQLYYFLFHTLYRVV